MTLDPRLRAAGVYVRSMAVLVALWWGVSAWTANPILLPSPAVVLSALIDLARDHELFRHAFISLGRLFLSLGLATLLGFTWAFYAMVFQAPLAEGLASRLQLLIAR